MFMVAFVPDPQSDPYYNIRVNTCERLSGFPHVIVSAASSDNAVFDIPFISQNRAIDRWAYRSNEIGIVRFQIMNPLTNINGISTGVRVFVTAQFVGARLFVPYTPTSGKR